MKSKFKNYLIESKPKILNEIFVKANEIANMKSGKDRDLQIARLSMIAELDAANLYEKFALLASDKDLKAILLDVANEEKTHSGEFEYFVEQLDPHWEDAEEEGEEEAEKKSKEK